MEINNAPVRLTADPEKLKTTANGKLFVTFSVAYNWRTRTNDGFSDVDTTFFRCTVWEEEGASEFAALGLRKGALLRVSGRWAKNRWTTNGGQARIGNNLTVTAVAISQSTEISRPETPDAQPEAEPKPEAQPKKRSPARTGRAA